MLACAKRAGGDVREERPAASGSVQDAPEPPAETSSPRGPRRTSLGHLGHPQRVDQEARPDTLTAATTAPSRFATGAATAVRPISSSSTVIA